MLQLLLPYGSFNDEWTDAEGFLIEISDKELEMIKKHQQYIKDTNVAYIQIWFGGEIITNIDGEVEVSDFRHDGVELRLFENSMFFRAHNKYDSSLFIESKEVTEEVINKNKLRKFLEV